MSVVPPQSPPPEDLSLLRADAGSGGEHQRMLALLIRTTEQGIWFIDNQLRTTDANPAMCRILGLPLDQILGRDIYSFVDEANAEIFREHVRRRAEGVAEGYEIALRRPDGTLVPCWNNATPVFDAGRRKIGAVGMFSDISALKRTEHELRAAHERLAQQSRVMATTLQGLRQGVITVDPGQRVVLWNTRLLELLQLPESLLARGPAVEEIARWQVAHGHFSADDLARFQAAGLHTASYRRHGPGGRVLDIESHAAGDGSFVRTFTDVTEQVRAEQALRDSEQRFRSMADAAPALIWQSDASGHAVWFNQRWLEATGRTLEDECARPWSERIHPEDLERCQSAYDQAVAGRTPFRIEYRLLRPDGRPCVLEDNGIPRLRADGGFEGYVVYGWDITARKAAEHALIAARDEAERASRAKNDFLSRMSHELRTPLNAVLGFAQLMQADAAEALGPAQRTRLHELQRGARHLLTLINDVLDLSRIEAGTLPLTLSAVDVAAAVAECLPLVEAAAAGRGLQLDLRPPATPAPPARADPVRLKQVLLNLLSNAVKYTPAGGRVWVAWQRRDDAVAGFAGPQVHIEVGDTGPGLAPQEQERLFQPFERLDAARSGVDGAGIGLALSKWLVGLMHGELGVDSAPGAGSRFWLRLAAAGTETGAPVPAAEATRPGPLDALAATALRRRVLYVEDNEVNRLLMQGMLERHPGVALQLAERPEDALAIAERAPPDLVLLDIQLPGIDGFEVLRRMRAMPAMAGVPVVAVSANAMPDDRERAVAAGFDDYVTKPIDMPLLLATVDRWLR
ncbi:MAG: PAS domain S-box protein [Rubrivivax sp.]|nr:PAS domain S-box protein [Rubrivivax sp.]